jgi:hypothetical protein
MRQALARMERGEKDRWYGQSFYTDAISESGSDQINFLFLNDLKHFLA